MIAPAFGYAARLQAQAATEPWLRRAGTVFYGGLLVASIIWWNGLIDPQGALKQAVFALVLACTAPLLYMAIRRGTFYRPFTWATGVIVGAVALSVLISTLLSPDHWLAIFGVAGSISTATGTWFMALMTLIFAATLTMLGWRPSPTPIYGGVFALTLFTFVQRFGWLDLSPGGLAARLFSPLGNELAFAWLAVCVGLAALAQEVLTNERLNAAQLIRRLALVGTVLLLFSLNQPTLLLVWLGGTIAITMATRTVLRERRMATIWLIIPALLALIGLAWRVPQPFGLPTLAVLSGSESWNVVQAAWKQHGFWFGAGLGQWSATFELVRPLALNLGSLFTVRFDAGGSLWWTILLQQGIFGALTWILFIILASIQLLRKVQKNPEQLPLTIAIFAGLVATFLMQPHGWGMMGLFLALGIALADQFETKKLISISWKVKLGVCFFFLLLFLVPAIQRLRADARLSQAEATTTTNQRRMLTRQASELAPWMADNAFAAIEATTTWIDEQIQVGIKDPADFQQQVALAIERSKAATSRWPENPSLWLAQGGLYAALGSVTQGADQFAVQAYQAGSAFAPHHPGFPLGMAQVFLRRAEVLETQAVTGKEATNQALGEARLEQLRLGAQWLKRALEQKPDDRSVRYAYALTLARAGDVSNALPLFRALWQEDPARADLALEYATVLAANEQRQEAIAIARRIGSQDDLFITAQRLLTTWYEAERDWTNALAALRNFPADEQKTAAFRQHLNQVQSHLGSAAGR